ncbi:MAG: uracil-DNA glycosylase [Chitinophagales bacterium]
MIVNLLKALKDNVDSNLKNDKIQLPNITIDTEKITAVMINEVVPADPDDDFYGGNNPPDYLKTTLPLFQTAGVLVSTIDDILSKGIYITNAVKIPKIEYAIKRDVIERHISILEKEIGLFPNLKVIMLMGDVAKTAFNIITKQKTGKNVVPSISTYKLRNSEIYYGSIRVFPSYIMTGGNILIEKSKFAMASEDIKRMIEIIG